MGINAESISGSLTVIDSSGANLSSLIKSGDSSSAANSIILDNVLNGGATVTLDEKVVVTGDVPETWVHGDLVRLFLTISFLPIYMQIQIQLTVYNKSTTPATPSETTSTQKPSLQNEVPLFLPVTISTSPCLPQLTQNTQWSNSSTSSPSQDTPCKATA